MQALLLVLSVGPVPLIGIFGLAAKLFTEPFRKRDAVILPFQISKTD
tara:strand:+ start:337 stop:477 length:141 start_codon:yes stop_codon:yes gene_type:complete